MLDGILKVIWRSGLQISVDDGSKGDIRLSELCRKYKIPLIVYLPVEWYSYNLSEGREPLTYAEAEYLSKHHTIGSHTVTHRHLTRIEQDEAVYEIIESKRLLKALFPNQEVEHFCPPRGYLNEQLANLVKYNYKHCRMTVGEGLVHVHPNSGANNNIPWLEYARNHEITEMWMHSWELDKFNLWDELENYMKEIS